jgi:uncharacterized membrane protein
MIQRIQSVYFLLTSAASIIFLSGDFLSFFNESGSEVFLDYRGVWMQVSGGAPVLLGNQAVIPVICLLLAILPIAAIFLYKNRKLQFKAAVVSVVFSAGLTAIVAWYAYKTGNDHQATLSPGFRMFLPLVMLVFSTLASVAIRKDENLVRSYDRLR